MIAASANIRLSRSMTVRIGMAASPSHAHLLRPTLASRFFHARLGCRLQRLLLFAEGSRFYSAFSFHQASSGIFGFRQHSYDLQTHRQDPD
ncbi:hypothetical protein PQR62_03870 [Herbaspirillum lusitanum]|uniref:Uncharacterized protein n=1 Tax=Herbaspirillum lusitanum TaxID=213312 RepID=A0ABW9A692_9BURK